MRFPPWLLAALLAGAVLRVLVLPLGGTGDVVVWKVWSYGASYNVTGMYGVGGSPPEQRVVHWNGEAMTVDYPPVVLYELSLVGKAYRAWDPLYRDSAALTVFIKLPGIILEVALLLLVMSWGRHHYGRRAAMWTGVALWLNPAIVINGPVLGYLDPLMYVPAAVAIVAASAGPPWLAGMCAVIAVLSKPQAVFVLPVIVALVCRRESRWKDILGFTAAASLTTAAALLPYVVRGAWWNMVQALSRLAAHDMLSAQAANLWWIVTWAIRVVDSVQDWGWYRALTQEVRILGIEPAMAAGYPNARAIGMALVAGALAFAVWRTVRARSLSAAAALGAWSLYAYAMLGAQVHENHLVAAIPMLAIAAGIDRRFRRVFWCLSAIAALNLYLFYGLVPGSPPIITRRMTVLDITVLLSIVNVGVFVWFTRLLLRQPEAAEAVR